MLTSGPVFVIVLVTLTFLVDLVCVVVFCEEDIVVGNSMSFFYIKIVLFLEHVKITSFILTIIGCALI